MRKPIIALTILAIWAVLGGASLASHTLLPIDETRYVTVAWTMWQRSDFLLPWLNHGPYAHKPPLLFWIIHAGWALTGVNEWWPRIGPGLSGLWATAVSDALARRLWPHAPRAAALTPFFLIGCLWWALFAAGTMFDMLLAACTATAMLGLLQAIEGHAKRGLTLTGVALGLGLLAKGPAILLHVLPAALLAPWWAPKPPHFRWLRWYQGVGAAVLLGGIIILAWAIPAARRGGPDYSAMIFWGQTAHRMVDSFAHQAPFWWYLVLLPALVFPWLFWSPVWRALSRIGQEWDSGLRFCVAWAVPVFVAFSLISGKQAHYLLPCLPAVALVLARLMTAMPWQASRLQQSGPALAALILATGLGLAGPLGAQIGAARWLIDVPALGGAALGLWGIALLIPRRPTLEHAVALVATLSILTVLTADWAVIRAAGHAYDLRPIAHHLKHLEEHQLPVAHLGKYHGQFQFLGRLQHTPDILGEDQIAAWFERHPNGRLILYFKTLPTTLTCEFQQRFAGRMVAVVTRDAWYAYEKNNPAKAAPGSGARMNVSPTKNA
jgi:4-amino-4-deoxy-L-arabinose transferase-like glycosyltransferase